ncbi:UDP-N-acetylmuramoylalanine/D-glutamate ligase [Thermaerobacter marianensis DSM 12885]|uniref:UDP-N-acetylmuramoylalanine--D-glutamate ligase n=1 Tax=Thermaerobacter marianensis (strain ATCC 700841 / DSM 12885 / JCM 10246 / 7p75a) TaxID=644966 RepID=E6SG60_THEM7|nr:UDP-N-acetylmuramoyl-L-alanine--D-glutamate ligase [Thermaerobacter marianensis]ADU50477.1 UDP-N-acetylmuramoylalanine/D-glutamate ligase [Thermaerobacter marianensis DSM 12885]
MPAGERGRRAGGGVPEAASGAGTNRPTSAAPSWRAGGSVVAGPVGGPEPHGGPGPATGPEPRVMGGAVTGPEPRGGPAAATGPDSSVVPGPVAVVGLGRSNRALVRYLLARGVPVVGCDRQPPDQADPEIRALREAGVELHLGPDYLRVLRERPFATVFLTPGMKKDLPEIRAARAAGAQIRGEIDLFLERCRAKVIGVTGSAGKTTTTSLIGEGLRRATAPGGPLEGRPVYVGGNIGRPLIEEVDRIPPEALVVLELSSFQLELCHRAPQVAVYLNLRPNHLDVHGSMEAYAAAKSRIVALQAAEGWAVLNGDDPAPAGLAPRAPGRVAIFAASARVARQLAEQEAGRRGGPVRAAYLAGEHLAVWDGQEERCVLDGRAMVLRGAHNRLNALAAILAGWVAGAPPEAMAEAAAAFRGVEHRLELVREVDGVRYYNDSIATAPDRTLAALEAFTEPVVLIAGGYDKGIPFDPLGPAVCRRARAVVLLGKTAGAIQRVIEEAAAREGRRPVVRRVGSLEEAVAEARRLARPGDVVLLSPACASYDMFRDYVERGQRFKELVRALG